MTKPADLTQEIAPRLFAIWDAYQNQDAVRHNSILADDYTAVHPDGSVHGKPSAQQIAAAPITRHTLARLRVVALAPDVALVSYVAEAEGPSAGQTIHAKYSVGEVWVRRHGEWFCRYYQGTPAK